MTTNFKNILHEIRNMKILTQVQINEIKNITDNEKMEIIILYNSIVEILKEINSIE
jgi:hypothetical protein